MEYIYYAQLESLFQPYVERLCSNDILDTWMKSLARMHVWWRITKDTENTITVQYINKTSRPHKLLCYIHGLGWLILWLICILTICCPVYMQSKMILIPIDTHSKWIEAVCTPSATYLWCNDTRTEDALCTVWNHWNNDHGTCFISAESEVLVESNRIKNITSVHYHLASNGLPECAIQIVMRWLKITKGSICSC